LEQSMKRLFAFLAALLVAAPAYAAGTIFGLPLSQQIDELGKPLAGGKLYIFEAGGQTPATAYQDFSLTSGLELPHPIELDSAGRIPEFWLADGSYRIRLQTSAGVVLFDRDNIQALGPSSGEGGGGGGVDQNAVFQTGDFKWRPVAGTTAGWVRANGRTIGSASSGASERANADTEELFLFLWANCSNTDCPVSSGRGANAAADWGANKTIGLPDMRGRAQFGLGDMGNTDSGVLADGSPTTANSTVGAEKATIAQGNLPNVNFSHNLSVGTSINNGSSVARSLSEDKRDVRGVDANVSVVEDMSWSSATLSLDSGTVSGTVSSGGSGTALNKMPPGRLGTWYIKL
jgi:microcystin-dependent protein